MPAGSEQTAVCVALPSREPLGRLVLKRKGGQNRHGTAIWYPFDRGNPPKMLPAPYQTELCRSVETGLYCTGMTPCKTETKNKKPADTDNFHNQTWAKRSLYTRLLQRNGPT